MTKPGPKPLPKNQKRRLFATSLNRDERRLVEAAAKEAGCTPSEWARDRLLEAARKLG